MWVAAGNIPGVESVEDDLSVAPNVIGAFWLDKLRDLINCLAVPARCDTVRPS